MRVPSLTTRETIGVPWPFVVLALGLRRGLEAPLRYRGAMVTRKTGRGRQGLSGTASHSPACFAASLRSYAYRGAQGEPVWIPIYPITCSKRNAGIRGTEPSVEARHGFRYQFPRVTRSAGQLWYNFRTRAIAADWRAAEVQPVPRLGIGPHDSAICREVVQDLEGSKGRRQVGTRLPRKRHAT